MVIFGGKEGEGQKLIVNDLFILDLETLIWYKPCFPMDKELIPLPRMGHSAQVFEQSIVVYGGWNGQKVLGDVFFVKLIPFSPTVVHDPKATYILDKVIIKFECPEVQGDF